MIFVHFRKQKHSHHEGMPDALSKTVPIWCAVMNRLLFPDLREAHKLHTPPKCVSPSEHSQMEARMDNFAKQIKVIKVLLHLPKRLLMH
jgi:tRNA A64-2'-O-ribosylphosphate transferase